MTWGNSDPWRLPYTAEMVKVFSGYGVKEDPRCPGCGAVLSTHDDDGVCDPCYYSLMNLTKKLTPEIALVMRNRNFGRYSELMDWRTKAIADGGLLLS